MPQVKGPMADPIIGLSYTVHDPDDWGVLYCFTESLFHKSVQEPAAAPQTQRLIEDLRWFVVLSQLLT